MLIRLAIDRHERLAAVGMTEHRGVLQAETGIGNGYTPISTVQSTWLVISIVSSPSSGTLSVNEPVR